MEMKKNSLCTISYSETSINVIRFVMMCVCSKKSFSSVYINHSVTDYYIYDSFDYMYFRFRTNSPQTFLKCLFLMLEFQR